ncbi:acyl-CoA/acyl-ACP dehydrogenase [Saccharopolyspora indica]|uniref:acyl-CoA dehydrogenase family protein n=1 Tax=Saccharopolyspora indica TaxID=1229659 RepID=UPI0022EA70D5|nr:acyl-CoA dehydrogenase family protein [Saccharopolyspora indica]MDA3646838.1 acyl-CoA/acyl-ACP dehydrogenase [Saccharopolyspora indica]
MDSRRSADPCIVPDFASHGLWGLQVPRKYGGLELSYRDTFRIMEQLGAIDCNLFVMVAVHNMVGIPPIAHHATEDVRSQILPLLARGQSLTTSAASEPGMGSDLRGMTTRAVRQSDGTYLLNGMKRWISLGGSSRFLNIFARLYAEDGTPQGFTGFTIDSHTPGFTVGPEVRTLGLRAVPQVTLTFEDMRVPAVWRLGAEGDGLIAANSAFMLSRLVIGAGSIGAMKRSLEVASRYARQRPVATGLLIDNGRTQQILTEAAAATLTVELLMDHITTMLDQGQQPHELLYFVTKIMSSEELFTVVDRAVQMLGGRGFLDTNIVGQFYRDYRLMRIFEGATEVVTLYTGLKVTRSPNTFQDLLAAIPGVSREVVSLISEAEEYVARRGATEQAEHIRYNVLGDLLCWSVLAALTSAAEGRSEMHGVAAEWCAHRLRRRLMEARRDVRLDLPSKEALLQHIAGYEADIGDTDQRRAGEEHGLDPLLHRPVR